MKKIWLSLAACLVVLAVVLFFPRDVLISYLFYEDEPVQADVIIVLSGTSERMDKAAELYEEGYSDKVLLTNGDTYHMNKQTAMDEGIAADDILIEPLADTTYQNATFSKDIVEEEGFDSALVVTSNYHMRRSKLAFDRVYPQDIDLTYVPYHHSSLTTDSWDNHHRLYLNEYWELLGGFFLYH